MINSLKALIVLAVAFVSIGCGDKVSITQVSYVNDYYSAVGVWQSIDSCSITKFDSLTNKEVYSRGIDTLYINVDKTWNQTRDFKSNGTWVQNNSEVNFFNRGFMKTFYMVDSVSGFDYTMKYNKIR